MARFHPEHNRLIMSLFRPEVLHGQKKQHYGVVSLNTPVHFQLVTGGVVALLIAMGLFFTFATFSEKFTVRGYLNSSKGVVRIYPMTRGVIVKRLVHQGQSVQRGDPLFLINTSIDSVTQQHNTHSLRAKLKQKKQAIERELAYKKNELAQFKPLLDKHYISLSFYHHKQEEIANLENHKNSVEMDLIREKQSQSYMIRAPIQGRVLSVIYHPGQYTNESKPLAKIMPIGAKLIAELFIPARHAGFLKKNAHIMLQYDAYPYARFGGASAVIHDIGQSILTDEEEDKPFKMGEPYYKVTAQLAEQSIRVYGRAAHIQQGMTLSGIIMGSKKKVWQWVFDPIYRYYGGMVA